MQAFPHLPVDQVRRIGDSVQIGRFTYFSPDLQLRTFVPGEKIVIGNFCSLAEGVQIYAGNEHRTDLVSTYPFDFFANGSNERNRSYKTTPPTIIGNDVWIGMDARILGGARIGDGAVITAGAVVRGEVPPYAIVLGNPAAVVRYRFSKQIVERLLQLRWWDWPQEKIVANRDWFYQPVQEFLDHFETGR